MNAPSEFPGIDSALALGAIRSAHLSERAAPLIWEQLKDRALSADDWEALCRAHALVMMDLDGSRGLIARGCAPWFERQDAGRYCVRCVDASGSSWTELRGFHYPAAADAAGRAMVLRAPHFTKAASFMWWIEDEDDPERGPIEPEGDDA